MTDVDDWREPYDDSPEPDISDHEEQRAQEEYWQHCDERHGGKQCDCPPFDLDAWMAEQAQAHRDRDHGGGECCCPPEEAPF